MTITAQRLLTELGNRAWSGFNKDDMVWGSDDAIQAQTELNVALRYLINLEDFPFRAKEQTLNTSKGAKNYSSPEGQITTIYNVDDLSELTFIGDNSKYNKETTGKPQSFWIDYNNPNQKIRLYPIPDDKYSFKVVYNQFMPVLSADNETKFEFTKEDDIINMPQSLEYLFMDCLVLRTMQTNNKDQQDENYVPTINEFNEAWRVFKKACKPAKIDTYVIF